VLITPHENAIMQIPTIMTLPLPDGGAACGASWASGGIGVGVIRRNVGLDGRTGATFSAGGGVFTAGGGVFTAGNGVFSDSGAAFPTRARGVPAGGVVLTPAFILKPLLPR